MADLGSLGCGACGYALNLSSSNRNTSQIDSNYGKAIKKGIISFFFIDESRFTQIDESKCVPYFIVKHSWGLLQPRTKLLCRKCGNYIGHAYEEGIPPFGSDNSDSSSGTGASVCRKYNVNIRSVLPSDASGTLLLYTHGIYSSQELNFCAGSVEITLAMLMKRAFPPLDQITQTQVQELELQFAGNTMSISVLYCPQMHQVLFCYSYHVLSVHKSIRME
ncbi:hypothetical protein ACLOJK_025657 [Asimina triloba]